MEVPIFVTTHALRRYREHHPGAAEGDVRYAVCTATEVDYQTVMPLCGRSSEHGGVYLLTADRKGIFVKEGSGTLVTYLRLGLQQQEFCHKFWPTGEPVSDPTPVTPIKPVFKELDESLPEMNVTPTVKGGPRAAFKIWAGKELWGLENCQFAQLKWVGVEAPQERLDIIGFMLEVPADEVTYGKMVWRVEDVEYILEGRCGFLVTKKQLDAPNKPL